MTVFFQDTFTVGSNTDLDSHTPDTGTSWSSVVTISGTPVALQARSTNNDCRPTSDKASAGGMHVASPAATELDVDVSVVMSDSTVPGNDDPMMMFCRYTDSNNWYNGGTYQDSANSQKICKRVGGTISEIGSSTSVITDGDTLLFRARGARTATVLSLRLNGSEILATSAQNESGLTGDQVGLGYGACFTVSTDDQALGWGVDDFTAEEFAAGAANPKNPMGGIMMQGPLRRGVFPFRDLA